MTKTDMAPIQVTFKHDAPKTMGSYEKTFKYPIFFNQPSYCITYKTSDLEMRTTKADASINKFLVERVEEETNGLQVSISKLSTDIELLIKDALPSGIPSIQQICNHIGKSNRTLARGLSENGVASRDLIKNT